MNAQKYLSIMGSSLFAAIVITLCSAAEWSMESPQNEQKYGNTSNVSGGGNAPSQGLSFLFEIIIEGQTEQSQSGTTSGPPGAPQMATWGATCNAPTEGWPAGSPDLARLTYYVPSTGYIVKNIIISDS